jgi:hypothetical protein
VNTASDSAGGSSRSTTVVGEHEPPIFTNAVEELVAERGSERVIRSVPRCCAAEAAILVGRAGPGSPLTVDDVIVYRVIFSPWTLT